MSMRNILVPLAPGIDPKGCLEAALRIARRVQGHVSAVYLRPDIEALLTESPVTVTAMGSRPELQRQEDTFEDEARTVFEDWRKEHRLESELVNGGLRSTFAAWSEQRGPAEAILLQRGRLSDLIVLTYPGDFYSMSGRLFDVAVFETGRPVLLAPKRLPDDFLRRVIIAWNGSLEATRAVAGALPLLHTADEISVFTAPSGNDEFEAGGDIVHDPSLTGYLAWHGIRAQSLGPEQQDSSPGAALLRIAREQSASLIVMGAYTRSRLRQVLLGGVTRDVLRNASFSVLMTH